MGRCQWSAGIFFGLSEGDRFGPREKSGSSSENPIVLVCVVVRGCCWRVGFWRRGKVGGRFGRGLGRGVRRTEEEEKQREGRWQGGEREEIYDNAIVTVPNFNFSFLCDNNFRRGKLRATNRTR